MLLRFLLLHLCNQNPFLNHLPPFPGKKQGADNVTHVYYKETDARHLRWMHFHRRLERLPTLLKGNIKMVYRYLDWKVQIHTRRNQQITNGQVATADVWW